MERFYLSKSFLLIGVLLAGFVASTPVAAAPPILVGIIQDVTGSNAEGGRTLRDTAIMCIEEWNEKGGINGRKIEYVFRDNAGDPTKATTIAKELVNLGVSCVDGGTSTTTALAEAAVLVPAQIPHMVCAMSAKLWDIKGPDGKWYVFAITGAEPVLAEAWIEIAIKVPVHKKVVILHLNNFWGKSIRDSITRNLKEKYSAEKMEVIDAVEMDLKAADASKEVTRLKALNPDVVISALFPDAYMAWFRACNDFNYHPPIIGYWGLAEPVYLLHILQCKATRDQFVSAYPCSDNKILAHCISDPSDYLDWEPQPIFEAPSVFVLPLVTQR